jgi:hypothetical protein
VNFESFEVASLALFPVILVPKLMDLAVNLLLGEIMQEGGGAFLELGGNFLFRLWLLKHGATFSCTWGPAIYL